MGYVLDTRSGMFYERESNFWYDPKTSLYCNAATSLYYSHSMLSNPPFTPVTPATFAASTSTATTTTQAAGLSSALSSVPPASASAAPAAPGKVAMKLKLPKRTTKSSAQTLPSKPPQAPSPPAELTAPSAAVDKKLSEWASRNTELRESEAKESEVSGRGREGMLDGSVMNRSQTARFKPNSASRAAQNTRCSLAAYRLGTSFRSPFAETPAQNALLASALRRLTCALRRLTGALRRLTGPERP